VGVEPILRTHIQEGKKATLSKNRGASSLVPPDFYRSGSSCKKDGDSIQKHETIFQLLIRKIKTKIRKRVNNLNDFIQDLKLGWLFL
jgi:hypothetical protein